MVTTKIAPVTAVQVADSDDPDFSLQGAALTWNYHGGVGETAFFNISPAGAGGGFGWYQTEPGTPADSTTTMMYLDRIGDLIVKGLVNTSAVQSKGDVTAGGAIISQGNPIQQFTLTANALVCYDPTSTVGSCAGVLRVTGPEGATDDPAIYLQTQRSDGANFTSYVRCSVNPDTAQPAVYILEDLDVTGMVTLSADPTQPLQAATKQYVDNHSGGGGSMVYPPAGIPQSTGAAWGTSISPSQFAYLTTANIFGPAQTFQGGAMLGSDPTTPLGAATKQYVDNSGPKVIQAADQATAISLSTANPNNIYFWV